MVTMDIFLRPTIASHSVCGGTCAIHACQTPSNMQLRIRGNGVNELEPKGLRVRVEGRTT